MTSSRKQDLLALIERHRHKSHSTWIQVPRLFDIYNIY